MNNDTNQIVHFPTQAIDASERRLTRLTTGGVSEQSRFRSSSIGSNSLGSTWSARLRDAIKAAANPKVLRTNAQKIRNSHETRTLIESCN